MSGAHKSIFTVALAAPIVFATSLSMAAEPAKAIAPEPSRNTASASQFDITDRLAAHRFYLKNHSTLYGTPDVKLIERFKQRLAGVKDRARVLQAIQKLDPYFADDELRAIIYWKFIAPKPERAKAVFQHYFLYRALMLRDAIEHPVAASVAEKDSARQPYQTLLGVAFNPATVTADALRRADQITSSLGSMNDPAAFANAVAGNPLFTQDAEKFAGLQQPYVLSPLGFIPGNRVELVSENEVSLDRINWVNERVTFNLARADEPALKWDEPYMVMPSASSPGNIIFNDPMFKRIRDMVDSSRESIFIDIFLFGGTMGGTLARHIVEHALKQGATNPEFRVLILHDYGTNYGLYKEIMPVFEYIRDRIAKEPQVAKHVMLMQANIQRHPPGIPFGITNLIPKSPELFKTIEKMDTYYESKIDHSKVIVVDPNSDRPKAYFGSKNWADHSGSYYYDDAVYVEGPGAAVVQALYYDDVEAALTTDPKELAWFYYKDKGLDNKKYLPARARDAILKWFQPKRSSYPTVGNDPIRFAEANVDGRIKNARNILVDMIRFAEKHIYMEQLFLYDKYVVDALIKRKRQVPSLDIRIVADHNGNFGLNGFPNTIFLKTMKDAKIQVRARQTYGIPFTFPNGEKKEFHQENHRKLTSVDGKWMLAGSSNINPDTLQGSFREFGAQLFNTTEIAQFESVFLKDWDDSKKIMPLEPEKFEMTLGKKVFSPTTSELVNGVARTILRSKDFIEKRENRP